MNELLIGYTAFTVVLGIFLYLFSRWLAVPVFLVSIGIVWFGGLETMGKPKPIDWEYRDTSETEVIAYRLDEPKAIYLWLNNKEPTAYALPWSKETARQLMEADGNAEEQGAPLMFDEKRRMPSEEQRQPLFYPAPQPEYPPKS